ncbi:MAG: tyrosine-type recombinase/integrase [Planctomycetota bacterium]|jgi:site-specific recombinase XerD
MEEIREQECLSNSPPAKQQQNHQISANPEALEDAPLPISISIYLALQKATKTQIFKYKDRSKWLCFILKRLTESNLQDKALVAKYLRHLYRHMCKAKTVDTTYTTIAAFLNYLQNTCQQSLQAITRDDLEAFIEHEQDRGLKLSTVRLHVVRVRAFIRFLIEQGEVRPDVLTRNILIKLPEALPRAIDPKDLRKFISVIDDVRAKALLLLLLRTGMRIGELLSTKVSDLNRPEQKIIVHEAQKTGSGRVVYYSADARRALEAWLQTREPRKENLFYAQGRFSLGYSRARELFVKYMSKAGLAHKGYSLHCLRHSFASELLNAGMRLECLQPLLGHTNIEVTRRYARLTDTTRKQDYFKAMQAIERGDLDGHY